MVRCHVDDANRSSVRTAGEFGLVTSAEQRSRGLGRPGLRCSLSGIHAVDRMVGRVAGEPRMRSMSEGLEERISTIRGDIQDVPPIGGGADAPRAGGLSLLSTGVAPFVPRFPRTARTGSLRTRRGHGQTRRAIVGSCPIGSTTWMPMAGPSAGGWGGRGWTNSWRDRTTPGCSELRRPLTWRVAHRDSLDRASEPPWFDKLPQRRAAPTESMDYAA